MSGSFTLPLRPPVEKGAREDALPIRITQINAQRGSFRNVTEESLKAEIEAQRNGVEQKEGEGKESDVDATERLDLLYKRRADITQFALQSHMEAMFALDFISLLLSKHAPRQAELSMSPHLKQVAPTGSLSTDIIRAPEKSEGAKQDRKTVSRGWKLESFNAAANKLLKSAARLEEEVAAETRYWGEVLTVKDKGWKVCRLPRERQALGVQYGFLEATPTFRDRGLASLRRAENGSLILDKGLVPSKARAVRVQVKRDGHTTGSSKMPTISSNGECSIEERILQARDTLYEEELFHELSREARIMASQGVMTGQNIIQFQASEGRDIILELVDINDMWDDRSSQSHVAEDDILSEGVAHSIRILLSYAHRQNLRRRRQIPPPLTLKKRPNPEYQLLRPITGYIQHSSHVRSLETFLKDVYRVLQSAGVDCRYDATPFSSINLSRNNRSSHTVEKIIKEFLSPFESSFSGTLATPRSSFSLKVRTHMAPPSLGTDYEFSINLPSIPDVQAPARLGLKDEVESLILHLITLDLVNLIPSLSPQSGALIDEQALSDKTNAGLTWQPVFPHHGELRAFYPGTGRSKKLALKLSSKELSIRSNWLSSLQVPGDELSRSQTVYSWKPDEDLMGAPGDILTLKEAVEAISREGPPALES
ncbi:mediator of RNA polymerase II transcription subunit 17 [Paecilomyces variotii No. 5]|uniref:Mediator of RNA polymerase II transcription subunit 17 n=1 Tax=Byssochlamys spectabilis (strain No. 5 / NBRC 109023) TaxID=1356009 RepID=V5GCR8_BYSSN|nr:mediator of RNA polymerase II transcription subunit 17 [Paecilomyces variotii No. 5]